jgi:REP element-mobilizing transposase RayT
MRERLREIIRQTCVELGVHIVRGVLARDHVHMSWRALPGSRHSGARSRWTPRSSMSARRITPSILISADFLIEAELPASWLMQISGTDRWLC